MKKEEGNEMQVQCDVVRLSRPLSCARILAQQPLRATHKCSSQSLASCLGIGQARQWLQRHYKGFRFRRKRGS